MYKIYVRGGQRLLGNVRIHGAKNAVLPIIAAAILASDGVSVIHEACALEDVQIMMQVLMDLGIGIEYKHSTINVDSHHIRSTEARYELVRKMRASILVMGPLLARLGAVKIALPGGCPIGVRPIDQHLKGFEAMGVEIEFGMGCINAKVKGRLQGAKIYLDIASVGATENIMMAATLAAGITVIENAAKEPEIVDLAHFLNAMGAHIHGAGTDRIRIEGVSQLHGAEHTVIPDRIEAGTYMIAAAITGGNVYIDGIIPDHLTTVISKLQEMGVMIEINENGLRVSAEHPLRTVDVKTFPYPGFPTDMQSQMMALLMTVEGTSVITENVFENRFMHVEAFNRMKGHIKVDGRTAIVSGNSKLAGSKVAATDLRAGAALILAALAADGDTEISGIHHIDRGYVDIVSKLHELGADILRKEAMDNVEAKESAEVTEGKSGVSMFAVQPTWA